MSADEILHKRAREILIDTFAYKGDEVKGIRECELDAMLTFAAEQSALAREAAIAEAAHTCRAMDHKSDDSLKSALRCAEAIERLSPAGKD